MVTRPGSMQLHRYTFEMARKKGAKKVTCGHKANIMKITDGLFLECFYEVAKDYPEIIANDIIVDDLAMKLVTRANDFDVIVLGNLQGDILSDLCAGLVGGLGFAPSANIGDNISIFEAVHGSAPDIAGKNIANPTSLLLSGCMMLRHLDMPEHAKAVEAALFETLEQGFHTSDFGSDPAKLLNTTAFAAKIISNLPHIKEEKSAGKQKPAHQPNSYQIMVSAPGEEAINGVDFFIESTEQPAVIAEKFMARIPETLGLVMISNRGTQVYPEPTLLTECVNQFTVRLERTTADVLTTAAILNVAMEIAKDIKICSMEWLMTYNGQKAYSLAQGQ